ncbi:hypothetical protein GCM10022223_65400 [Kineosporia mesophila]|uniref:Uncharacterized protein n=1 Tax=Kineosporia mesophila TaxID=566012 RepID=A0ABP7APN3_9ACTN
MDAVSRLTRGYRGKGCRSGGCRRTGTTGARRLVRECGELVDGRVTGVHRESSACRQTPVAGGGPRPSVAGRGTVAVGWPMARWRPGGASPVDVPRVTGTRIGSAQAAEGLCCPLRPAVTSR